MPKTTGYQAGVPCWMDLMAPDTAAARHFYGRLFGWDFTDTGAEGNGYQLAALGGELVAGIGPCRDQPVVWTTYLWADDADAVAARVEPAGGQVLTAPFDVLDQGRMAIARDPSGGVFGIWQGRAHRGAGLVNEPGTFVWNEELSTDPAAAREFYHALFGYEYEAIGGPEMDYTVFKVAGRPAGGIGAQPQMMPAGTPSFWNVYFAVSDTDGAVATVRELGGQVLVEPNDTPFGRMAVVRDPAGAGFALIARQEG